MTRNPRVRWRTEASALRPPSLSDWFKSTRVPRIAGTVPKLRAVNKETPVVNASTRRSRLKFIQKGNLMGINARTSLIPQIASSRPSPAPSKLISRLSVSVDRKSTRLNSSHLVISYAVFCLNKKTRPAPRACPMSRSPRDGPGRHAHRRPFPTRRSSDLGGKRKHAKIKIEVHPEGQLNGNQREDELDSPDSQQQTQPGTQQADQQALG